jgi:hypothetical protein
VKGRKNFKLNTEVVFYFIAKKAPQRNYMVIAVGNDEGAFCFEKSTKVKSNNQIKRMQERRNNMLLRDLDLDSDNSADY